MSQRTTGDSGNFDLSWRTRKEALYTHWTRERPRNQIQLAFRSHWQVFQELIGELALRRGDVLEVGCGRGSLSSYFADAGWNSTLLDYSPAVLETARSIFEQHGLKATFVPGDANQLPFPENSFDVTFSIGLLEHFENVRPVMSEQLRVLRPGGWFLGYVVPERPDNVQRYFNWINRILRIFASFGGRETKGAKPPIYRSDFGSEHYVQAMEGLNYGDLTIFGMYPMPMVSHSPEFPFSLLPAPLEWGLTRIFEGVLALRRIFTGRHGWICSERMGQAFLVAFRKPLDSQ
ncbi:MAG: methyltransferase domain-containing protein [Azonexus sp.]|nr:methyltransferase domain-containing protein [Betaproteobacteria bacterium]MBP6035456.1 methyltransferase domain-containing protein [Azonexus sp.]MBP6906420.1 methyltransferase domain-containing protein [Azonexus sp.]